MSQTAVGWLLLAAAVGCGLVMNRLRMPAAAGFILVGMLLDFWNETFLGRDTLLAVSIGIALVPELLTVEFQMAQYASGLVQHVGARSCQRRRDREMLCRLQRQSCARALEKPHADGGGLVVCLHGHGGGYRAGGRFSARADHRAKQCNR